MKAPRSISHSCRRSCRRFWHLRWAGLAAFVVALLPPFSGTQPALYSPALYSPALGAEPAVAAGLATFARDDSPHVQQQLEATAKHYRQIEPSLYHLSVQYADRLATLSASERLDRLVSLARFIDQIRDSRAEQPVIAPGRTMIGLLDPDRGLDRKEISAIAEAYGALPTIHKQRGPQEPGPAESIHDVATAFLQGVRSAAAGRTPTTIVVLGHGMPEEIQSYAIPCGTLADALVAGAVEKKPVADASPAKPAGVDLSHLVLICDDCYSADFLLNLGREIEARCSARSLEVGALPTCIAGTNRDSVGHADVSEKFVPHFWKDVIELFYVRRPRPEAVTLGDFFGKVDNMMYGYGRTPIVQGGAVAGYRLIDPTLCQDPVVFVSLEPEELKQLRDILGLDPSTPVPLLFDIG
ncbi:MAG: hypothetical protein WCJ21_13650 [Planctomycetota bacterium]